METKNLSLSARELRLIQYCVTGFFIKNDDNIRHSYSDASLSVILKIDKLLADF